MVMLLLTSCAVISIAICESGYNTYKFIFIQEGIT